MIIVLQRLRAIKQVRAFVWQTFNGFVTLIVTLLGTVAIDEKFVFILPFVYSGINALTKYINTVYFGDLWVSDKN